MSTETVFCVRCGREGHRSSHCPIPILPMPSELTDEQREQQIKEAGEAMQRAYAAWERRLQLKESRAQLTQAKVREYLSYVPETGLFFWKKAAGRRAKVGAVAGCITDPAYTHRDDARAEAHAWLVRMEGLIRGRSAAMVARLEHERGLQ